MVDVGTAAQDAQSENDIAGGRPKSGRYHVQILESEEKTDVIPIQFGILDGSVAGQDGKTVTEQFWLSEAARPRLHRLLLCIGIRPFGEVDIALAIGRQLIIEVEEEPYVDKAGNDKIGISISYMGMWSVGNSEVADVPKNAEALATWMAFTSTTPPALAQQPQQAAPVTPATAATAPAAAPTPVADPVAPPVAQQPPAAAPAAAPVQQQQAPAPATAQPEAPPAAQPAASQQQPPPAAAPPADPYAAIANL